MKASLAPSLWCAVAAGVSAWNYAPDSTFREALSKNDFSLVAFIAPSLESSKSLGPEWAAVEAASPNLLSVDCMTETNLCAEHDVISFPTVRFYHHNGSMSRYRGPRKASHILGFLKRVKRSSVTELNDANIEAFVTIDDFVFVAQLGDDSDDSKLNERFADLATRLHDRYSFGKTRTAKGTPSSVRCYNNLDGLHYDTSDLAMTGSLERIVKQCTTPLVPELTRRNEMEYHSTGKSLVYYFSPSEDERKAYAAAVKPLTRKYADFLSFVTVDSAAYPEIVSALGVPGREAGVGLSVSNARAGQIFPKPDRGIELATEEVEAFIVAISNGKVMPWDGTVTESDNSDEENVGDKNAADRDEL